MAGLLLIALHGWTGQPREEKTAKWAIRERQVNPLVKLLSTSSFSPD